MKVLILAGGFATRLWPLTERRAKPLLLVDGKTILAHILSYLEPLESIADEDVYLLTNQAFEEDFKSELEALGRSNINIFIEDAESDGQKLGALKALSECIKQNNITDSVMILAGDNLMPDIDLKGLLLDEAQIKIASREVPDFYQAQKFGVLEWDPETYLVKSFEEKPQFPKSLWVSTGFVSIGAAFMNDFHTYANANPDALGGVFQHFQHLQYPLLVCPVKNDWFDVGSFETYLEAHKSIQKDLVLKAPGVSESKNTYQGKVFLGEGSTVLDCTIIDSIIYPGCQLKDCVISNCVIDTNTKLSGVDINQKLIRGNTTLEA